MYIATATLGQRAIRLRRISSVVIVSRSSLEGSKSPQPHDCENPVKSEGFELGVLWVGQVVYSSHLVNHASYLAAVSEFIVIPKVKDAMLTIHNRRI